MSRFLILAILILIVTISCSGIAQDQATEPTLQNIQALTRGAAELYKAKDYAKSAEQIALAQKLFEQLRADLEKEYGRIERAHQLLIDNGQQLPELIPLNDRPTKIEAPTQTTTASPAASETSSQVSFSNDVAPVLAKHCGNCHIRQARGQFSAASYADLVKGSVEGPAVIPGSPDESNLVVLIESRQMPPRSRGIPDLELQILKNWIRQGAVFDGADENAKISIPGGAGPGQRRGAGRSSDDN